MNKELVVNEKGDIKIFENPEFGKIRVINCEGNPWFVLKDVCEALDLTNPTVVAERLDEDEKNIFKTKSDLGLNIPNRGITIITESGLYNVILRSDKPEAKQFKRWVTHEILPSIRKHGAYMTQDVLNKAIGNPDFMIGLLTALKEEQEKVEQLNSEIEENRPATLTGKAVESSTNGILVGQYVPVLREAGWDIGSSRLFKEFREDNFLCSQKGLLWNKPSQFCLENDYMKYRTSVYTNSQGEQQTSYTPLITGKGQLYFLNYYKNKYGF